MENQIKLVQEPVIKHELAKIGKSVTERLESLNIDNLVATEDTVKSLKDLRSELNKELKVYEEQRKAIKTAVLNPYQELEESYKIEISEKYKPAIDTLKDKISIVENKMKDDKRKELVQYFNELCGVEKIDFISFEMIIDNILLSTSLKAYREKIEEFISKIKDDIALINSQEFATEIFIEYKKNLNVSQSITSVTERKKEEREEEERRHAQAIINRKKALADLNFELHEFSQTYMYNDKIFVPLNFVNNADKEEFTKKFIELQEEIKEAKKVEQEKKELEKKEVETTEDKGEVKQPEPSQKQEKQPEPEILEAPKVEKKEETVTASFEVIGTMSELQKLGNFMKENKINYKNI